MSIGLTFTGKIDSPQALLEAAKILAAERNYHLTAGESGLKVTMCPLGGELGVLWRPERDPAGPWLVRGGCMSTPAGAGPAASAAAAKTLPSKVAPRSAKKIAPGTMCRESVTTRGWAVNRSYRVDVVSMSLRLMPESVSRPVPRRVRPPPGCFAAYRDDPRRSATAAAASAASPAGAPRSGQMNRSPVWYFTSSMYFLMFCSSVRGQIISTSSVSTTMYSFRPLMTATLPSGIEMMLLRVS